MRKLRLAALLAISCGVLSACGQSAGAAAENAGTDATAASIVKDTTPVGIWERSYQDAVGQQYHEVLEFRDDGTYVKEAKGWMADNGRYTLKGKTLGFRSSVRQQNNRDVQFTVLNGKILKLTMTVPFFFEEYWVRRSGGDKALFPTAEFEGKRLPVALAPFALLAHSNLAQAWRDDAILVAVEIEEHQSSDYALVLSFVSPRDHTGMQVRFTPHDSDMHYFRDVHWGDAPLPPDFVDLKPLLEAARKAGMRGALRKAELRVWKGAGPVWRIFPHGPRGASFSALTGKRIEGDVTGYVAQYNADWSHLADLWRQAMNRMNGGGDSYREMCHSIISGVSCGLHGCEWSVSNVAGIPGQCYPDLWIEELNNRDPNRWRVFMRPPPAAWGKVR